MVLELSRKLFYSTMNGSDSVLSQLLVGFILIFFPHLVSASSRDSLSIHADVTPANSRPNIVLLRPALPLSRHLELNRFLFSLEKDDSIDRDD